MLPVSKYLYVFLLGIPGEDGGPIFIVVREM